MGAGDRVMTEPEKPKNDKAEAKEKKPRKPLEYKRFERLLKQVIKSGPMRKSTHSTTEG
jgi:hypothetical protein